MRLLLALVIWLLAVAFALPFVVGPWQPPEAITEIGRQIDEQFRLTFLLTGIIFLASQFALGYAVWKFGRKRSGPASATGGNDRWEVLWTSAAGAIFLGLTLLGYSAWAEVRFEGARAAAGESRPSIAWVLVIARASAGPSFGSPASSGQTGLESRVAINR